jgi:hypothetical protein
VHNEEEKIHFNGKIQSISRNLPAESEINFFARENESRQAPQKQASTSKKLHKQIPRVFLFDDEEVDRAGSSNHKSKRVQVQKHQISYENISLRSEVGSRCKKTQIVKFPHVFTLSNSESIIIGTRCSFLKSNSCHLAVNWKRDRRVLCGF